MSNPSLKVLTPDSRFEYVMALALNPKSEHKEGVIRCITSREGDVAVSGFIDRSKLFRVKGESLNHFDIVDEIHIKNQDEIVKKIGGEHYYLLGLEDPDIFIDEYTGLLHLYFTMPFMHKETNRTHVHLGHAVGKELYSLEMTMPVLMADEHNNYETAKEVSIAPKNKEGLRLNLIESSRQDGDFTYSTVRLVVAEDMAKPWKFGKTLFHPKEQNIKWIAGHASPGPLLPQSFMYVGEGKLLGIMNGREANEKVGDETRYGMFTIGLFIYDYEKGEIDWVSPDPIIQDPEAETITFASHFVETGNGEGILYAHVDDAFVRSYELKAEEIMKFLPKI